MLIVYSCEVFGPMSMPYRVLELGRKSMPSGTKPTLPIVVTVAGLLTLKRNKVPAALTP